MRMNDWKSKLAMSLVATGVGSCSARADLVSTLTGTSLSNNTAIPANHGSTAEATLTWSPDSRNGAPDTTRWDAWNWPNSGADGAYQIDGVRPWVSFAPVAGHRVGLNNLDLSVFAGIGGAALTYEIRIWNGVAPGTDGTELALFSGTAANNFATYSFNSTITPVNLNFLGNFDQTLTIEFRQTHSSATSYLAMDNFTFQTQAVPEPSALAVLSLAGLGASLMRRRRNK